MTMLPVTFKVYTDDTQDLKALAQIAYCNMMAGKLPEAEKSYLNINALQPDNIPTLFSLVSINSRRGHATKAKSYLQQIIRLDSMNFSAYKQLAAYEDTAENKLTFLKKANTLKVTDPDGRKPIASNEENRPLLSSALEYNLGAEPGPFSHFLGRDHLLRMKSGKGKNVTVGDIARSFGISLGDLDSFIRLGAILSFREQLIRGGFDSPEKTKASFGDWKKIIKTEEIAGLISTLYTIGNYKSGERDIKFNETDNFLFHGKSNGFDILLNLSKNTSVLEYGYIIGHEINHSITFYFRDIFFETINSNKNRPVAREAFSYFSEYISYSWEVKVGNLQIQNSLDYTYSKHGAKNLPDIARYPESAINTFTNNINVIMKAYSNWYNNIK